MSNIIEDGKGRGYKMSVSSTQRGNVSSKSNPRSYYVSRDDGRLFSWYSTYSATSGDYVLYIKNTDQDRKLVLSTFIFGSDNNAQYTVERVSGTAGGTAITPTNFNLTSGRVAQSDTYGNAAVTGLTNVSTFGKIRSLANAPSVGTSLESLILGTSDAIAVKFAGTTGVIDITVFGYYEYHDTFNN